jgi:signal transduction histidine kinase
MRDSIFAELVSALDMVLLERVDARTFSLVGRAPGWFLDLCPEAAEVGRLTPGERFPFLDAFLDDAEAFWAARGSGQLKSGPWIEVDAAGAEHRLEASALEVAGAPLLLLEFPKFSYDENLAILQAGREASLDRDRLVRETQKKEVLLHCIVHDLRGPLTGIMGGLAMLEAGETLPGQQEWVELALRQSQRLELLISEILHAFKAEIDALETFTFVPEEAPDAVACANETVESLRSAFELSEVGLKVEAGDEEGRGWKVVGERVRLERVLSNLLANALRYSPKGSTVTVGLRRDGDSVTVSVEDEGAGVPEDLAGRLFEKFSQGKRRAGSTGLGLYFCRMTVERWGGTIGYAPRPRRGSRFWFKLHSASTNRHA